MVGMNTLNLPSRNRTQAFGLDSPGTGYGLVVRASECGNGFLGSIKVEIFLRSRKTLCLSKKASDSLGYLDIKQIKL
jgi:hypothetical protein